MELKKQTFKQNVQKSKAVSQITLDEDCIIKDQKPDLLKIIHTRGTVVIEDVKVSAQTVWVTGQLRFLVLYRSEDNRLESLADSVSFGEKLFMDEIGELDSVRVTGKLEDLNIVPINSRKLAVRALVVLHAVCEQTVEETVAQEAEHVQQRSVPRRILTLAKAGHDMLRVHSELTLPQSSPNIGRLLYESVEVRNTESASAGDRIRIQGEAHVSVLYASAEGKLEWYETMAPFSEELSADAAAPICWVCCRPAEYELEAAEDYDGELRALSLSLSLDVDYKLWEERELSVLTDVYALDAELAVKKEPVCTWKLLVKNEAKLRIAQQLTLGEGQERILQLCSCEGSVDIDRVQAQENGFLAEGVLTVHILYATMDDRFPIAHAQEQIAFSQVIDAPGVTEQMQGISCEIDPAIDQLTVNLMDNERFEVKAVVSLTALVLQEECFEKITEIEKEPLDAAVLMCQPGITGYIVQKEEQLWDIARRFRTTEQELMETNGLKSTSVLPGTKLVIVKRVEELVS